MSRLPLKRATTCNVLKTSVQLGNACSECDLARDPRWGRTEESYGEDAFLTARLTVANIKGLQGDNPRYWRTAALMKHFLANSNEDRRDSTSSNFDMRLFYEYYAYPFYKGITEGESHAFMAAITDGTAQPCAYILA